MNEKYCIYLFSLRCCCRLSVPFTLVPELVSRRQVIITSGLAQISCRKARSFLTSVFTNVLSQSVIETRQNQEKNYYGHNEDDQRLVNLLRQIRRVYLTSVMKGHREVSHGRVTIRARQVEAMTKHFPLCFRRVHHDLVRQHRLQHHARVAYTLYLKEIGLPCDEAVTFWSHYYKRDAAKGCTSCTHSWDSNSKKFSYRFQSI